MEIRLFVTGVRAYRSPKRHENNDSRRGGNTNSVAVLHIQKFKEFHCANLFSAACSKALRQLTSYFLRGRVSLVRDFVMLEKCSVSLDVSTCILLSEALVLYERKFELIIQQPFKLQ